MDNNSEKDDDYKIYKYTPQPYMNGTIKLIIIFFILILILNWLLG